MSFKKLSFLFCLTAIPIWMFGQDAKRNSVWSVGYDPVVKFNFMSGLSINAVDNINTIPYCIVKSSSSCISDTNGNLQFFSNGFFLYDSSGYVLDNGLYVNCPSGNMLANYYGASLFDQTSIILPKKGNRYYVFSIGMSDSAATNYLNHIAAEFDVLNYSVVDMDSNNGKGKVIEKNVIVSHHQHFSNSAMHAIKHANGKDWWLIKADCLNNRYVEYLVLSDTILGPLYQQATDSSNNAFCIGSFDIQVYFNNQGTQMASGIYGTLKNGNFYDFNRVDLYDFNRCDGSINFKRYYEAPYDTSSYAHNDYKSGLCFSPNDSLIYMSNSYTIYQIDLMDTNRYNATFIHGPDTAITYFPEYATMAAAPDGKIYIGNSNGTRKYMSYIDKPNVKGLGCNFIPNGVWQPYTNLRTPPNMPNYGLGADSALLIGCTPVAIPTIPPLESSDFSVYPNPTYQTLYFQNAHGKTKLVVNALGEIIISTTQDNIDVSALAKGLYFIHCNNKTKKVLIE